MEKKSHTPEVCTPWWRYKEAKPLINSADVKEAQESSKKMDFVLDVLSLMSEIDCYYAIWWRCDGEFAPVTFFVNCNDLFVWATADCEQLTPDDMPALRAAISEVHAIDIHHTEGHDFGFLLWCARKRGMRPQQPAYPKDERLRSLYDACGPERDPKEEG